MHALTRWFVATTTPVDIAMTACLAALAAVETTAAGGPTGRTVVAVLTVLPLLSRRRAPAVVAAIVAVGVATESFVFESPDQMGVLLAVVVAAFSAAAYTDAREAVLGLALLGMSISASIAVDPTDSLSNVFPSLLLFIVVPAGLGFAFHRRGGELAALESRAAEAEGAAEAAVEAERMRIARELHDVVSHAVTLIAVQAEAGQALPDTDVAGAKKSLESISAVSRDVVSELHTMLTLLHEPMERGAAGLANLDALISGVRSAGLAVTVQTAVAGEQLSDEADHCAFRVVQEGLTNALRHAQSPDVHVAIRQDGGHLRVQVESTGQQHQSTYGGSGSGLVGLRDRVAALGGELTTSAHGDTFRLQADIPAVAR